MEILSESGWDAVGKQFRDRENRRWISDEIDRISHVDKQGTLEKSPGTLQQPSGRELNEVRERRDMGLDISVVSFFLRRLLSPVSYVYGYVNATFIHSLKTALFGRWENCICLRGRVASTTASLSGPFPHQPNPVTLWVSNAPES
ncbi:unnamed protein product [Allacma fusca]|uniref:Uncharacterized protein n=1 Tax=Allacma fusca TaxID=39272 RepID=A0A8J2PEQ2_9HEXA|nr:unnamed protein product [Allacma fusca]